MKSRCDTAKNIIGNMNIKTNLNFQREDYRKKRDTTNRANICVIAVLVGKQNRVGHKKYWQNNS